MIETTNQIHLDWQDIEHRVNILTKMIKNFAANYYQEAEIMTISRGGLVPATMIAHRLGKKKIHVWFEGICPKSMPDEDKRILFIDDIVDTGKTLMRMRDVLYNYQDTYWFLCKKDIYENRYSNTHLYYAELTPNKWVVFPWERYE